MVPEQRRQHRHGEVAVFDRDGQLSWDDRIWHRSCNYQGHTITVWGM